MTIKFHILIVVRLLWSSYRRKGRRKDEDRKWITEDARGREGKIGEGGTGESDIDLVEY